MLKTTKKHKKFWTERKIDWKKEYLDTWNHPHRSIITYVLRSFHWFSLWEVGCGPGPNLLAIMKDPKLQGKQLGGSDVNPEAIELARSTFVGGRFHVESSEDILLSDKSVDVVLTDASLIYISPLRINKVMKELVRVARNNIVLCEFHSTSLWKRWWFRYKTGYNAYNYKKLLEDQGCYDVQMIKITKDYWDGEPWTKFGYVITCKVI